jgi:hypothetical protein
MERYYSQIDATNSKPTLSEHHAFCTDKFFKVSGAVSFWVYENVSKLLEDSGAQPMKKAEVVHTM